MKAAEEIYVDWFGSDSHTTRRSISKRNIINAIDEGIQKFQPQWIKVEDRLPDFSERVLALAYPMDGKKITIIDYRREYKHLKGSIRERLEYNNGFSYGVTHWMTLPQPPKED